MTQSFQRFAGWCAVLVAIIGVVFTIAFAIVVRDGTHSAKMGKRDRAGGGRPGRGSGLAGAQ